MRSFSPVSDDEGDRVGFSPTGIHLVWFSEYDICLTLNRCPKWLYMQKRRAIMQNKILWIPTTSVMLSSLCTYTRPTATLWCRSVAGRRPCAAEEGLAMRARNIDTVANWSSFLPGEREALINPGTDSCPPWVEVPKLGFEFLFISSPQDIWIPWPPSVAVMAPTSFCNLAKIRQRAIVSPRARHWPTAEKYAQRINDPLRWRTLTTISRYSWKKVVPKILRV